MARFSAAWCLGLILSCLLLPYSAAQTAAPQQLQEYLRQQARALRAGDAAPTTAAGWQQTRRTLRERLLQAWGGFPEQQQPCPLQPQVLGQLQLDGCRVERVIFQTLPDVWMTANAWILDAASTAPPTRLPAVLCVHGHWSGAKQDPVVQSRCLGLAKLGFFVLSVDAFGAGERGVNTALGEYHGEMTGALLLPIGRPLSGLQVYENMRAVDYLQSRPEVDPLRIGITGASGGGNQTMYAGAMDERFRCVVPTCSVGNYQAYLRAACCMCEVVPGALRFTEEGDVLGLAADRGLMVTSATQDAFQFSVDQARISVERARAIAAFSHAEVRHTIIESPHHYNQPMREAMYGWMSLQLKGQGDGGPLAEPPLQTVDPETLRCFPGDSRPADYVTIPRLAAREARRILAERAAGADAELLQALTTATTAAQRGAIRNAQAAVVRDVLAAGPVTAALQLETQETDGRQLLQFDTEPGLRLFAWCDPVAAGHTGSSQRLAVLVNPDAGADATRDSELAQQLRARGWRVVVPELRGTGRLTHPGDRIGHAPDHNSAEWSLWVGQPLLGQWVRDVQRTLEAVAASAGSASGRALHLPQEIALVGAQAGGLIALATAAVEPRFTRVAAVQVLGTWVSDTPYRGQRLGLMVPGILPACGDVAHIAALCAPRRLVIAEPVGGSGAVLTDEELAAAWKFAQQCYAARADGQQLQFVTTGQVVEQLSR